MIASAANSNPNAPGGDLAPGDGHLPRRAAVILVLDVVNSTGLMEVREERTFKRWISIRAQLIDPQIAHHRGIVLKGMGDGLLVEFGDAANAVRCALELQKDVTAANATLLDEPPIELRIAVHMGTVMPRDGDIYGHDVNVAVRLHEAAAPGGIVVSEPVHGQIADLRDIGSEDLGPIALKNLSRAVRAFRIGPQSEPRHWRGFSQAAYRPSIAVLPFRNPAESAEEEYFTEGILDDVVNAIAGIGELLVLSRASTRVYKSVDMDLRQLGRQLGVRYVVTGRAHHVQDRFTIAPELTDTEANIVLWSKRYELQLSKLFDVQDEISRAIVSALLPNLRRAEIKRIQAKRTENLDAHDLVLQATQKMYRFDRTEFSAARQLFERAMALDPNYARAYALCAEWHTINIGQGYSQDDDADYRAIERLATAAIERNPMEAAAMALLGHVKAWLTRDFDAALELFEQAQATSPNSSAVWGWSSPTQSYLGDCATAVKHAELALRLAPLDPHGYYFRTALSLAHYAAGAFEEAIKWCRRTIVINPRYVANLRFYAASLAALGRLDEAKAAGASILAIDPTFRAGPFAAQYAFKDPKRNAEFGERLRVAGIPQ